MLADPQSVTINGSAVSLPRTKIGATDSEYTAQDGTVRFNVKQNTTAKRFRREVRLSTDKIAADPLTGLNSNHGLSVYLVIDEPRIGVFTDAEVKYRIEAMRAWLAVAGNQDAVLGGQM